MVVALATGQLGDLRGWNTAILKLRLIKTGGADSLLEFLWVSYYAFSFLLLSPLLLNGFGI